MNIRKMEKLEHEADYETRHIAAKLKGLIYWIIASILIGLIVGAYSSAFAYVLGRANLFRQFNRWTIFLLPLAGLAIVFLYRFAGLMRDRGTNQILSSISEGEGVPGSMSLLIFASTVLTHICGGSAGREGAALQMGGSIGDFLVRITKRDKSEEKVFIMCGMSAAFSAVFGTPMAAVVFAMEAVNVGMMRYSALLPCTIASITAKLFAVHAAGLSHETFAILKIQEFSLPGVFWILVLGLLCAALSALFAEMLHRTAHLYARIFKNPYIRAAAGGLIIIVLTLAVGSFDYNGSGSDLIERAIGEGEASAFAFILKMIFTVLTLGAGFKGGEIVPSFCIGATFGCIFGQIVGLSPSFCAACGMAAMFCGVTNCPITTMFISFELFGYLGIPYFMIVIAVSYAMSGYRGLYGDQIIMYSKYSDRLINRHVSDETEDDELV